MTDLKISKPRPSQHLDIFPEFSGLFNNFFGDDFFVQKAPLKMPAVNIAENEKGFTIEVQAPGFSKDEFNLKIEGDVLTISGEHKSEKKEEDKKKNFSRKEFHHSSFSRQFTLPENIDVDNINAKYDNGILNIDLAKKAIENKNNIKSINVG